MNFWEDFYKPRIVYGQFQDGAEYSFSEAGIFLSSNEYMIIVNNYSPKCLLAFLNSKITEWLLSNITGNLGGNAKIGQKSNFLKLSVAQLDIKKQMELDYIVDKIIERINKKESTIDLELAIDRYVYCIYNIADNEIKYIESRES